MTCMMRYDQAYVVITRTSEIPSSRLKNAPCDKIWRTRFLESRCSTWLALQERKLSINTLQTSCFLNNKRSFRRVIENVMQYMLQKLCDNICATVTIFLLTVSTRDFFVAGPPDAPENCDVHNHTTQGLSVTCQRGFGGGLEQTFHMEVRDRHSGHLLQNLSKTEPIFTVR